MLMRLCFEGRLPVCIVISFFSQSSVENVLPPMAFFLVHVFLPKCLLYWGTEREDVVTTIAHSIGNMVILVLFLLSVSAISFICFYFFFYGLFKNISIKWS